MVISSEWKVRIAVAVSALMLGIAIGHFTVPTKVTVKTEVKEVVKEVDKKTVDVDSVKKNNQTITKTETILPDGTRKIETKTVDTGTTTTNTDVDSSKNIDKTTDTKTTKITESDHGNLMLYGIVGAKLNDWASGPEYGVGVQKRLLGPIWIGVYGTNKTNAGLSLGVSF